MIYMVWKYKVMPEHQPSFEELYGAEGSWAKLFGQTAGFVSSTLIHHTQDPFVYMTLDQWSDELAFRRFMHAHKASYETLDKQCSGLTFEQHYLGTFAEPMGSSLT